MNTDNLHIDDILKKVKRIHFIGIGGAGMCPLAEILIQLGYNVSGSDNNDTETFRRIEKEGAKVYLGQVKDNITDDVELVIYTNAILKGNEELEYAKANRPCFERAELLGAMSRIFTNCIGVCGTHGKTTTSSMLTQVLLDAGLDPSAVIGGKLPAINAYGRFGHSQNFVCESCEFNNTFLHMNPDIAVILNIDEDHLDFFKNLDNIKKSFRKFAEKTTKTIVYNGDDKNTVDTLKGITGKKLVSVGRGEGNEWIAKNVDVPGGFHSKYDAYHNGEFVATVHLSVPGEHNVLNSLCAFAAAYESGADVESICEGLQAFKGAGRRFEILGKYNGITFADDYAHHPDEITATLNSAKNYPHNKIWCVFQPHTYSRTKALMPEFAKALSLADNIVLAKIYPARETDNLGISSADLMELIKAEGKDCYYYESFEDIEKFLLNNCINGDLLITMGAGDVYKIGEELLK